MRVLPILAVLSVLGGCGATSADPPPRAPRAPDAGPAEPGGVSLVVQMQGIRNASGVLRVGLFEEQGFPDDGAEHSGVVVPARQGTASATLKDLAPGSYAVAVYHDENANGVIDTGLFGQPTEGVGFSRNATATFGVPDFEDVAVEVGGSSKHRIEIEVRYWGGSEVAAAGER